MGITAEFYKSNPYMAAEVPQPILEEAWLSEAFPDVWTDGIIEKIPKKGNLKICDNWRGICVLPANHLQGHTVSDKRPYLFHHRS